MTLSETLERISKMDAPKDEESTKYKSSSQFYEH